MGDIIVNAGSGTSEVDAWANQFEASKWQVGRLNPQLVDRYTAQTSAFNAGLQNGIEHHPENYPKVPASWVLDPAPPSDGSAPQYYVFYSQTGGPVCPEIPMWTPKPKVTPGNVDIGPPDAGNSAYYDAGPNDAVPNGQIVTGPDGRRYQKIATYLGTNKATGAIPGWYLVLPDAAIQSAKVG